MLRLTAQLETRFWPVTWLVVRITRWLIVIHLVEIALWALFFWWRKCLPDEATQAWIEMEINRAVHSELGEAPLHRYLGHRDVGRPCPSSALRSACAKPAYNIS